MLNEGPCKEQKVALALPVPWTADENALLKSLERALHQAELRAEPVVGLGERSRRLALVGRSCRQALEAVDVALRLHRYASAVRYDDVIPEALLARDPQARYRLVHSRLDPVLKSRQLLATLQTFLACNRNQRHTAEALGVHANTVAYRLRRIEALLGRDLGHTDAVVDLSLALRALNLNESPGGATPVH